MKAPARKKDTQSPLDQAIEALNLARESGGDLDYEIYEAAHQSLEQLKAKIIAYDEKLSKEEAVPDGDDYNQIIEMMVPSARAEAKEVELGKIWWNADTMAAAVSMQAEYLSKGAKAVELLPEDDRPIVGVIITLDKSRAKEILGHDVDQDEWLEPDEPSTPSPSM